MPRLGAVTSLRNRLRRDGFIRNGLARQTRRFAWLDDEQDTQGRPILARAYLGTPVIRNFRTGQSTQVAAPLNEVEKDLRAAGLRWTVWAGGHLIGDQFGGPDDDDNLVPVPRTFNLSDYKQRETVLAEVVQDSSSLGRVILQVKVQYPATASVLTGWLDTTNGPLVQQVRAAGYTTAKLKTLLSRVPSTISWTVTLVDSHGQVTSVFSSNIRVRPVPIRL